MGSGRRHSSRSASPCKLEGSNAMLRARASGRGFQGEASGVRQASGTSAISASMLRSR